MLELKAAAFYGVTDDLRSLRLSISDCDKIRETPDGGAVLEMLGRDSLLVSLVADKLRELAPHLETLGASVTLMAVDDLLRALQHSMTTYGTVKAGLDDIDTTLRRELSAVKVLTLNSQEQAKFEPLEPLFGREVAEKFPSITYEIKEAGKCLALERSTASVFHAIRCLEADIAALSLCLDIPPPTKGADRSWFKLLGALKDEIDRRWPPKQIHAGDAQFFGEAHAALAAMQNPWRNATMHLDQKYAAGEARHIFAVVEGFMRRVASRCDEQGEPKA